MNAPVDVARQHKNPLRIVLLGLAYILFACIAIGANPFKGETTGPFDLLASYPGWNPTDQNVSVRHGARSDILDSVLPDWIEASRQIRNGHLPLWNPLPAGGRAGIVDPTRSQVSPAFLAFLLSPDPELGFYFATLLNLCIAGLGMHLLVRRYQSIPASFFAGISYMMCGFLAGWLFWPHIATAIWLPWLLWSVSLELDRHKGWKVLAIAAATAFMFMGGFPFVMAIGLGCALAMLAIHLLSPWWSEEKRSAEISGPVWVAFAILAGLGLVCVPLLSLYGMLGNADLSYRSGGSSLTVLEHGKLLFQPWAGRQSNVETSMYVGMLALALAVPGTIRAVLRPRTLLGVSAVLFLVVGFVLTFGILPDWIGSRLPVLSNNPWSRAILLLDFSLILLAAIGLDAVFGTRRWKTGAAIASVLVVLGQGGDLIHQFRKFNGPTDGGHFYETVDIVAGLRGKLQPFEHVSQDGGVMLISGTSGAVGLGDWFAHSMRSAELHNMLDAMAEDPFNTATATMIDGADYHWGRPLMDMAANCYLIDTAGAYYGPQVFAPENGSKFAIGPVNSRTISQKLVLDHPVTMSAVAVEMATYQQTGLAGYVDLTVSRLGDVASQVASSRIDAKVISDNARIAFVFDQPVSLTAGSYELRLRYEPGQETRNLTLWAFEVPDSAFSIDAAPKQGAISFAILGPSKDVLKVVGAEGGIAVYENPGCMKGAYWTHDLTNPLASSRVDRVRIVEYRPHDFTFEVTADSDGFLVIPMNLLPGWRFSVDGIESEVQTLAGVMPAILLPEGQHSVRGIYRPPYLLVGSIVSICSMLLLILVVCGAQLRIPQKRGT